MKSRPILFSAPMVRALLAGTKTQTRRAAKLNCSGRFEKAGKQWHQWHRDDPAAVNACPYGQPGDCLWVKETHRFDGLDPKIAIANRAAESVQFFADEADATVAWRPSIFMHRWASRLTLEITEIRVERLQAITEADALAEGVTPAVVPGHYNIIAVQHIPARQVGTARDAYRVLWEQLNGPGSWALNPYVWVLTFRRVTP